MAAKSIDGSLSIASIQPRDLAMDINRDLPIASFIGVLRFCGA